MFFFFFFWWSSARVGIVSAAVATTNPTGNYPLNPTKSIKEAAHSFISNLTNIHCGKI